MNRSQPVRLPLSTVGWPWGSMSAIGLLVSAAILSAVFLSDSASAQPPGTFPPAEMMRPSSNGEPGKLPIKGFFFLDAGKNPVMVPSMTFERLTELESETNTLPGTYIFDQVNIEGKIEGTRAEMQVLVRLSLESTGGETISIPLGLENFHRIGPAEFLAGSSADRTLAVTIDERSGSYLLVASTEQAATIEFRMRMSARVQSGSARSLTFDLPPSPTLITLTTDSLTETGEIANRDDEVLQIRKDRSGRTQFLIESGGGRFTMRWGALDRPAAMPLLEADSRVSLRWNSPQDQPIQSVLMELRDLREPIAQFQLRIPKNALLVDTPTIEASGQAVELSQPDPADKQLFTVTIPKEEQRQRFDLNLDLQLTGEATEVGNELDCRVPEVVGALRHKGTIEIQVDESYRLRWRQRLYVQNVSSITTDEGDGQTRTYTFRFNRGVFSLPIWLGESQRQIRISSQCELEIYDSYINLVMEIAASGSTNRARLTTVDLGNWQSPQVFNSLTGAPLTWYESGDVIEIETASGGMDEIAPIQIRARQAFVPIQDRNSAEDLELLIPRVVGSETERDPVTIQEALIRLTPKGRSSLVVDLERSAHLERSTSDDPAESSVRTFQIMPPDASARITGTLVEELPRLLVEPAATATLSDEQIELVVDWLIESQVDLRGRLFIEIPEQDSETLDDWSAWVNDRRAAGLTPASAEGESVEEENRFLLVSDDLASGVMRVRFRKIVPVDRADDESDGLASIAIPRPLAEDVTLRQAFQFNLVGDTTRSLVAVESGLIDDGTLRVLPIAPIKIRVTPRKPTESELTVDQVLIRTAANESAQHDQVIAGVIGQGDFVLKLPRDRETEIRASVDGKPTTFQMMDDRVSIPVSGDARHTLDIRIWADTVDRNSMLRTIEPLARLSPGTGGLLWSVHVPGNQHLVWAVPSAGRSMQWVFDRWRLVRQPWASDTTIANQIGSVEPTSMPLGNRYLFNAVDSRSFRVMTGTRTLLWMIVAGVVVLCAGLLSYVPATRTPFSAAVAVALFGGLLMVAPDASILFGQLVMASFVIVVLMFAIRSLVRPLPSRVLVTTPREKTEPSTRIVRVAAEESEKGSVPIAGPTVDSVPASTGEVAS